MGRVVGTSVEVRGNMSHYFGLGWLAVQDQHDSKGRSQDSGLGFKQAQAQGRKVSRNLSRRVLKGCVPNFPLRCDQCSKARAFDPGPRTRFVQFSHCKDRFEKVSSLQSLSGL